MSCDHEWVFLRKEDLETGQTVCVYFCTKCPKIKKVTSPKRKSLWDRLRKRSKK